MRSITDSLSNINVLSLTCTPVLMPGSYIIYIFFNSSIRYISINDDLQIQIVKWVNKVLVTWTLVCFFLGHRYMSSRLYDLTWTLVCFFLGHRYMSSTLYDLKTTRRVEATWPHRFCIWHTYMSPDILWRHILRYRPYIFGLPPVAKSLNLSYHVLQDSDVS